jgi:hypothetical protein
MWAGSSVRLAQRRPALALLTARPTGGTALSVLVHCIPPISRFTRRAGLVALRQTFVFRCHVCPGLLRLTERAKRAGRTERRPPNRARCHRNDRPGARPGRGPPP